MEFKSHSVQYGIDLYLESDNSVHTFLVHILRATVVLTYHLCLVLPNRLFPSALLTKIVYAFFISHMHATFSKHFILLHLINIIFNDQYKSWNSSLCSFLHCPPTLFLLLFITAPCSWIFWVCSLPSVWETKFYTQENNRKHYSFCRLIVVFVEMNDGNYSPNLISS